MGWDGEDGEWSAGGDDESGLETRDLGGEGGDRDTGRVGSRGGGEEETRRGRGQMKKRKRMEELSWDQRWNYQQNGQSAKKRQSKKKKKNKKLITEEGRERAVQKKKWTVLEGQ